MQSNNEENKCIDCKECKSCHCPSDLKHNDLFCEQVRSLWCVTCPSCQPQNEAKEEICNFCLTPGDQGAPIHPHSMTTHKQSNNGTTK